MGFDDTTSIGYHTDDGDNAATADLHGQSWWETADPVMQNDSTASNLDGPYGLGLLNRAIAPPQAEMEPAYSWLDAHDNNSITKHDDLDQPVASSFDDPGINYSGATIMGRPVETMSDNALQLSMHLGSDTVKNIATQEKARRLQRELDDSLASFWAGDATASDAPIEFGALPETATSSKITTAPSYAGVSLFDDTNKRRYADDASDQIKNEDETGVDSSQTPKREQSKISADDTSDSTLNDTQAAFAELHPEKWQALLSHGASPSLAQAILSDPRFGSNATTPSASAPADTEDDPHDDLTVSPDKSTAHVPQDRVTDPLDIVGPDGDDIKNKPIFVDDKRHGSTQQISDLPTNLTRGVAVAGDIASRKMQSAADGFRVNEWLYDESHPDPSNPMSMREFFLENPKSSIMGFYSTPEAGLDNVPQDFLHDTKMRRELYIEPLARAKQSYTLPESANEVEAEAMSDKASALRNSKMEETRAALKNREYSETLKPKGIEKNEIRGKISKIIEKDIESGKISKLSPEQMSIEISKRTIDSAFKPNPYINTLVERAGMLEKGQAVTRGLRSAGPVLGVIGAATDGYSLGSAINQSIQTDSISPAARESARVATAWGAAYPAGILGAEAGAGLGAFGGPLAPITVPAGGLLGGLIGGALGYAGGSKAATSLYDWFIKKK